MGPAAPSTSVIPAVNTCMNCHRAISYGSNYGTAEISKIFASIGWDPLENAYIANYDQMTNEQVKDVYRKWIANKNLTEGVEADDIEDLVEEQLAGIEEALTNEYTSDERIAGPIEWVRIHNVPDHVYFIPRSARHGRQPQVPKLPRTGAGHGGSISVQPSEYGLVHQLPSGDRGTVQR